MSTHGSDPRETNEEALREEILSLKQELAAARSANASKEAFLSSMSHDIRTPMNAIIGMAALAKKHIDEKSRVMDALEKIETAGGHLLGLINDVLDMSRINSGRLNLNTDRFFVSDLLHDLLIIVKPQMQQKEHTWKLTADGIEAETLRGDVLRLRQIYVNIISNAIKYTPSRGRVTIHLTEEFQGETCILVFRCEDNGIGMTPEFLSRIFEPFERVNDTSTSKIEGTGLGMSIVSKLLEAMEGTIDIDSTPGEGTAVTIRIPLGFEPDAQDFSHLRNRRLLILESDARQKALYEHYLAGTGLTVEIASSVSGAFSALTDASFRNESFDLAVIGLRQEESHSPFELAEYLHKAHPQLPLVLATEDSWENIEYQANRSGIQTFIPLPFFRKSLLSGISRALESSAGSSDAPAVPDLTGKRILLVEDNLINQEISGEILSMTHASYDIAGDGQQAVNLFIGSPAGTYSLILMDVQMPVMDGYEATRAIRTCGRADAAAVPIYAMTANTFAEDIAKSAAAGMNGHLPKPIDLNALMRVLASI